MPLILAAQHQQRRQPFKATETCCTLTVEWLSVEVGWGGGGWWVSAQGRTQLHVVREVDEGYWPMNTPPPPVAIATTLGGGGCGRGWWWWCWRLWWPLSAAVVISLCYSDDAVLRPVRQSREFEWFGKRACWSTHPDTQAKTATVTHTHSTTNRSISTQHRNKVLL